MRSRLLSASLVVALSAVFMPTQTASALALSPGCAPGTSAVAASKLFGDGAEVVSVDRSAGLDTALVHTFEIAPAVRHRMVSTAGAWCDATRGFNSIALDGRKAATAFASVGAAMFFDEVTVSNVRTTGQTTRLRTHAVTNGVEADWKITTDALGVKSATWTATELGVQPMVAEFEGLTALPGSSMTYNRALDGTLTPEVDVFKLAADSPEVPTTQHRASDGFIINISVGDTTLSPNPGFDTGIAQADQIRYWRDVAGDNYEEFLTWGLRKGWSPAESGTIYINDALSAYCLACVFIADNFQIHLVSEVVRALGALGYKYNDPDLAFRDVVGHEMFHNFQNAYTKPGPLLQGNGRRTSTAYSEGTARFQETIHSYASVSFAPNTLVTADKNSNSCSGYDDFRSTSDASFASNVAVHTYDACRFFMLMYRDYGIAGLVRMMESTFANGRLGSTPQMVALIEAYSNGKPYADVMADFAAHSLTMGPLAWGPATGAGPTLDWVTYLKSKWVPAALANGETIVSLDALGQGARQIVATTHVTVTPAPPFSPMVPPEPLPSIYVVRSSGGTVTVQPTGADTVIAGPAAGEQVWVVLVGDRQFGLKPRINASAS